MSINIDKMQAMLEKKIMPVISNAEHCRSV